MYIGVVQEIQKRWQRLSSKERKKKALRSCWCSDFSAADVAAYDAIAFGCPAMGAEVLEESEFQPMFDEVSTVLGGKKIALFGSYGWGSGEWMENWENDCKSTGAELACDSVICNNTPDDDELVQCQALGAALA